MPPGQEDLPSKEWEIGLLKVCKCFSVQLQGGFAPDPLTRGSAPGPRRPQTPVIGSRYCARHVVCPLTLPGKISMGAHATEHDNFATSIAFPARSRHCLHTIEHQ